MDGEQVPARCPNPLFLQWLGEWRDLALELNRSSFYTYRKAYNSMERYPAKLSHPIEALCLDGVGVKIVEQLEQKLREYCLANNLPMPSARGKRPAADQIGKVGSSSTSAPTPKKPRKDRPYIPNHRSGAYGILLTLLDSKEEGENSLTQEEICSLGQKYCDASYTVPDHGKFFTAWNGVKTLLEKGLVYKSSKTYTLTREGEELALRMRVVDQGGEQSASTSSSTGSTASRLSPSVGTTVSMPDLGTSGAPARSNSTSSVPRGSDLVPSSTRKNYTGSSTSQTLASQSSSSSRYEVTILDSDDESPEPATESSFTRTESFGSSSRPIPSTQSQSSSWTSTNVSADIDNVQPSIDRYNSTSSLARYGSSSSRPSSQSRLPLVIEDVFFRLRDPDYTGNGKSVDGSDPPALSRESLAALADFSPLVYKRNQYEICLILDNREVRTREDRDYIEQKLLQLGIPVIKRALEIGDYAWVARPTTMHSLDIPEEIVLDYICERKRMDDLVSSIKYTRFEEQKFRLSRSGIGNIIYLVETYKVNEVYEIGPEAIQTALTGCQVVDGFFVKRCQTMDQTIEYLASVTQAIERAYQDKDLFIIPDNRIDRSNFLALKGCLRQKDPSRIYHTSYSAFRRLNSKSDAVTVKDTFCKMLMTVRGVSAEKAVEIARSFGTPRAMFSALDGADNGADAVVSSATSTTGWKSASNRLGQKRNGVIARAASGTGRKKIGPALSEKIAHIWYSETYNTHTLSEQ